METMKQFVDKHQVKMSYEYVDSNPFMNDTLMNHYKVILSCQRRQYTTVYSMGVGIERGPEIGEVLECLASDAAGVNGRDFEEWTNDYGFSPDSIKALKIYHACEREAKNLKRLLGDEAYQDLLWDTERL